MLNKTGPKTDPEKTPNKILNYSSFFEAGWSKLALKEHWY